MPEFDIMGYLDDRGIRYDTGGKDVGRGWIGIHCPFPLCDDHARHCGINLTTLKFKCWICGEHGSIVKLLAKIEESDFGRAKAVMSAYPLLFPHEEKPREKRIYKSLLPEEATDDFPALHWNYLRSRRFDPEKLIPKFGLKAVYNVGDYRGCIIAPCFLDRQIVSFVAADVTRTHELKYVDCPVDRSIVPVKHTFYNIDSVGRDWIVVEGMTDVWRLGDGAVGSFTSNLTIQQIRLLISRRPRRVFILFDPDAYQKAKQVGHQISPFTKVEVVNLKEGDPADLSDADAQALKMDLIGKR